MRRTWFALALPLATTIHAWPLLAQRSDTVSVGGRRVEVIRLGTGSPTLVLESGGGEGATEWNPVIADLAKLTRVVAYSRTGHGKSGPLIGPGSPQRSVAELHELLGAIGESGPVIVAGHSWGGLLARLYASTYPAEVAGLVLIDATHEAQFLRWQAVNPAFAIADTIRAMVTMFPPAARIDFEQMLGVQDVQRVEGMKVLPSSLPLAVITALKPCAPQREFTCRDPRALAIWRGLHHEWFSQVSTGLHLVSAKTEHYVMNEQPDLILRAVGFVLEQAREQRR